MTTTFKILEKQSPWLLGAIDTGNSCEMRRRRLTDHHKYADRPQTDGLLLTVNFILKK